MDFFFCLNFLGVWVGVVKDVKCISKAGVVRLLKRSNVYDSTRIGGEIYEKHE